MPFVEPSLRTVILPSNEEEVSVIYGQDTPEMYNNLIQTLILLGKWINFISAGIEIVIPYNIGYRKQKMLMFRYHPERIGKLQVPMYIPSRPNQMQNDAEDSAAYNGWRFSNQKSIRTLLATSHVTSFNEFFSGICFLVETVQNLVNALQTAKMQGAPIDNVDLETIVQESMAHANDNTPKLAIAAAFCQCIDRANSRSGSVVYPAGVDPNQIDPRSILQQLVIQKLQTSFIEQAMQYFAGARETLPYEYSRHIPYFAGARIFDPSTGRYPYFVYVFNGTSHLLTSMAAVRGRFDRRARKYWSPFSWYHGRRGIEVVNPDDLFEAPFLRQMRDGGALNSFNAELAARALFESVHTIYKQRYADSRSEFYDYTITLSRSEVAERTMTIGTDGCGIGLPVQYNLIDVMRLNSGSDTLDKRFVFERPAALGQTTLGLFPSKYSDEAITLYNTMQQAASGAISGIGLKGRYTGLLREDSTVWMQWLDEDLHPSNPEGTLQNATSNYERDMEDRDTEEGEQPDADGMEADVVI